MGNIAKLGGLIFFWYSNEHEPIHVHVKQAGREAKIDLVPEIKVVYNRGFSPADMRRIKKYCKAQRERFIREWEFYFEKEN